MYCLPDHRFPKHLGNHCSEEKERVSNQFQHFAGQLGCRGSISRRCLDAFNNRFGRLTSPKGCRLLDLQTSVYKSTGAVCCCLFVFIPYDFDRLGEIRGDKQVELLQSDCHQEASEDVHSNSVAVSCTNHGSCTYSYGSRTRL